MGKKRIGLDPEDGDYVKYIENIQNGKIKPEGALKAPVTMHDPLPASASGGNSTTSSKRRTGAPPKVLCVLAGFLLIAGISFFATGILTEYDEFIPIGMFTLFAALVFTMNLKK
jgi:hypothetical protein